MVNLTGGGLRRSIVRRSVVGVSVASVVAGLILTSAAASSAASSGRAATPDSLRNGNNVTQSTSSAAGTLTAKVKYQFEPKRGTVKLLAVSFAGDAAGTVKNPALIVSLSPGGPPCAVQFRAPVSPAGQPRQVQCRVPGHRRVQVLVIVISLRGANLKDFSGSLPLRLIDSTRGHGGVPAGEILSVNLASISSRGSGRQRNFSAHPVMQLGMVLTPSIP
jgi:hypothetical protein